MFHITYVKNDRGRLFSSYLFSKRNIDLFLMKAFISFILYINSARAWTGYNNDFTWPVFDVFISFVRVQQYCAAKMHGVIRHIM